MFGDAVQAILSKHPGIELLGATDDPEGAAAAVAMFAPEVILLEEAADRPPVHLQAILTNPVPSRLVTLRIDRDGMHVWSQQWRASIGPDDLLEAIVSANGNGTDGVARP